GGRRKSLSCNAEGGTRTHTPLRRPDFECSMLVLPSPTQSTLYDRRALLVLNLRRSCMQHRRALLLYEVVQDGGTNEAPTLFDSESHPVLAALGHGAWCSPRRRRRRLNNLHRHHVGRLSDPATGGKRRQLVNPIRRTGHDITHQGGRVRKHSSVEPDTAWER